VSRATLGRAKLHLGVLSRQSHGEDGTYRGAEWRLPEPAAQRQPYPD
jgi:hypothetical protein